MTTYTSTLRLREPALGGDTGTWGTYINDDLVAIDAGVNGILSKSIAGLTTYTMVANGSTSDEARYAAYSFTGALSSICTITLPANAKIGLIQNATTGGYALTITTGSGGTVSIPADSAWYRIITTGSGLTAFALGVGSLKVQGATTLSSTLAVTGAATLSSTLAVTGAATFSGTTTVPDGVSGSQAVNFSQFPQATNSTLSYVGFPGAVGSGVGLYIQCGVAVSSTAGSTPITFGATFPTACVALVGTAVNASAGYNVTVAGAPSAGAGIFTVRDSAGTGTSGITVHWIAMGY